MKKKSSSKEKDLYEINQEYTDTLKEVIALKEQEIQTQERTIAFLKERVECKKSISIFWSS